MTNSDPSLADLRRDISEICREVGRERVDGELRNDVVLERVRARLGDELQALTPQLVQMALVKIINDCGGRRRRGGTSPGQADLFEAYDLPRMVSVGRGRRRDVASLTVGQARSYLENHGCRREAARLESMRRLLEECLPFARSEDDTLGSLMERRASAEEKGEA